MVYWVVGWKTDPLKGTVMCIDEPKSSNPGRDVERALSSGCSFVRVEVLEREVTEEQRKAYVELMADSAMGDETGKYFDPPLLGGVLTYQVIGMAPTGKFHPIEKERMLYRPIFKSPISANPRRDVERALRLRCTKVSVGVNYEPSEEEKLEQEELDRQEGEEAEKERKFLQRGK